MTIQPELIQRIKEAQSTNSTLATLKKDAEHKVNPKFRVSVDGVLDFRTWCVFHVTVSWKETSWQRLIAQSLPYIPKILRYIKVCDSDFGGMGWKERWPTLFPSIWYVNKSRQSINAQPGCFNHYQFRSGSGNASQWISWYDCLGHDRDMMPFG